MVKNIYSTKSNHFKKTNFTHIHEHKKLMPYFSRNTYFVGHLLSQLSDEQLTADLKEIASNGNIHILFICSKVSLSKLLAFHHGKNCTIVGRFWYKSNNYNSIRHFPIYNLISVNLQFALFLLIFLRLLMNHLPN